MECVLLSNRKENLKVLIKLQSAESELFILISILQLPVARFLLCMTQANGV